MPYVCNDCGKSFRYKVTQRTHKCLGKVDGTSTPQLKPLINPLAEDNANISNDHVPIGKVQVTLKIKNVAILELGPVPNESLGNFTYHRGIL